jgi:putative membrane protein
MAFGPVMMILVVAAIVVVIVLAVRVGSGGGAARGKTTAKNPVDILKERFARGEIDAEEFAERKRRLED